MEPISSGHSEPTPGKQIQVKPTLGKQRPAKQLPVNQTLTQTTLVAVANAAVRPS